MIALVALWEFSLALCAVALLAVVALVVARGISGNRETRRAAERRRLMPLLIGDATGAPLPRRALERREAMQLTLALADLVRGSDREQFIANAATLGVPATLRKRLKSRVPQERLLAAEALAMFPGEQDAVRAMLADANPDVRLGAALSLAQNRAPLDPVALVRMLGLGSTERSLLVISLLRDIAEVDPQGVETMFHDPSLPDAAKLAAVDALAVSGRVEFAPLVAWMAEAAANDTPLQPRIYRALGRIGHPSGHAPILAGLDNDWWQTRSAAAEAAGRAGLTGAVDRLADLLGDEQWWVRFRSGEALFRLGRKGRECLERVAAAGTGLAADAARDTLAERLGR